ncbi:MAG: response regulator transcription factor [Nitrospirota bacterium]|nr:response regulator transcription factor [Nitrospirota bacterium]
MPIRIFIFEDHWMCREALVSVLNKESGIEVLGSTGNVRKGIEEVIGIRPEVVLMDIRFHGENLGIGATSTIKDKLPETNVIIFTEFPDEETLQSAVKAGASGFLLKNEVQDPDIIINAIQAVHHGDAYMTPSMTSKILKVMKRLTDSRKYELTKRELQILKLITDGNDNKGIAGALDIETRTVANHVSNILFKLNVKNRTEAAAIARKEGLID